MPSPSKSSTWTKKWQIRWCCNGTTKLKRHAPGSILRPYNSVHTQQTISTQSHLILRDGQGSPFRQLGGFSESVTFTSDEHLYETKSPLLIWECDRFAARCWYGQTREKRLLVKELFVDWTDQRAKTGRPRLDSRQKYSVNMRIKQTSAHNICELITNVENLLHVSVTFCGHLQGGCYKKPTTNVPT
jgi:hypothetical protein